MCPTSAVSINPTALWCSTRMSFLNPRSNKSRMMKKKKEREKKKEKEKKKKKHC